MHTVVLIQKEKRQPLVSNIDLILRKKLVSRAYFRACYRVAPGKSVHPVDSTI